MLDFAAIITSGGLIVFQQSFEEKEHQAHTKLELSEFIQKVFLQQKIQTEKRLKINQHVFQYHYDSEKGLLYVIVFLEKYETSHFEAILSQFVRSFESRYLKRMLTHQELAGLISRQKKISEELHEILVSDFSNPEEPSSTTKIDDKKLSKKQKAEKDQKDRERKEKEQKDKDKKPKDNDAGKKKDEKVGRVWEPALQSSSNNSKNNKQLEQDLNFSRKEDSELIEKINKEKYLGLPDNDNKHDSFEYISSDEETEKVNKVSLFSRFKGSLVKLGEGKTINEETLKSLLDSFKDDLIRKNVAEEIARKICENLKEKLNKQKSELLTSTKTIVKSALKDCLVSILTPKNNIDLLSLALKRKEEGRPFVVAFIGVNGVGKSTNLAKIAYLFKSNKFSVMLAACDNFRAGAVEQLKTHGKCLEVPVFDRGYKDDPANIARDAIAEASAKKIDVVLIDTAGRMQDNEPLMRALARLVNLNNPDVVLFIGEALVGNDGIDQLTKFNSSLKELSEKLKSDSKEIDKIANQRGGFSGREIDGIILSKFDTVDDKVGAALSLTYSTGKPIVYVGVGQKYPNIKKLNVDSVVSSLLS